MNSAFAVFILWLLFSSTWHSVRHSFASKGSPYTTSSFAIIIFNNPGLLASLLMTSIIAIKRSQLTAAPLCAPTLCKHVVLVPSGKLPLNNPIPSPVKVVLKYLSTASIIKVVKIIILCQYSVYVSRNGGMVRGSLRPGNSQLPEQPFGATGRWSESGEVCRSFCFKQGRN